LPRSLVIGGCGFLGSHVVDALVERGHEVRVLDLFPPSPEVQGISKDVEFLRGDMLDPRVLEATVAGSTYVFHYGTTTIPRTSIEDPELDSQNLVAAIRIIRAATKANVEKIVFPSSGGTVYGKPDRLPIPEDAPLRPGSPYAATKLAIEYQLAAASRSRGLDYAVLRYGNPYGPRQDPRGKMGVVAVVLGILRDGGTPTLYGDGRTVKDFFYAGDAASAAVAALAPSEAKVFNVASGHGTSILDLFEKMGEILGRPIVPKRAPALPGDEPSCVLDIRRIREVLGWSPRVGLEEGLRTTWDWLSRSRPGAQRTR
jgi:UDP-glucose 4-epimerase